MFKHILIPTDTSVISDNAVKQGLRFAQSIRAKVTCFHAIEKYHASDAVMGLYERDPEGAAKAALAYATERLAYVTRVGRASGLDFDVEYAVNDDPAAAIIHVAQSRGCDLILMASHGRRGIERLVLGSETQKVLTHSKIPVLVYR